LEDFAAKGRVLMAGTPVDDRIEAILGKYDLRDKDQYRDAVAELTAYLLTLSNRQIKRSLYHQRLTEKLHLEKCFNHETDESQPL
jgi:hypothetical protein